jgi:signal transduction histidine kinase
MTPFDPMTSTPPAALRPRWQLPRIDPNERWIGGVAAAVATEIGVQPLVVRLSFLILALAGGWGLVFYVATWAVLAVVQPDRRSPYVPEPKGATSTHRHLAVSMVVMGLLLAFRSTFGFIDEIVFPLGFVSIGFLIAWTYHTSDAGVAAMTRIVAGVFVGVGGMIAFFALSATFVEAVRLLVISLAIISGIVLVAAPSLARIGRDLDSERQDRVRADERARVAAHLHDSVLQTLALIQRHAADPSRTAQLARQQERELRQWLYGTAGSAAPGVILLGPALEDLAADVDADHGVPVKVITVGDNADLAGMGIADLVAATREAAVNAAKHSGSNRIDVFAERHSDRIEVFIRDTGVGFDPSAVDGDRRGISHSIKGRMERAGGSAAVHTSPGEGTEVELVLPLTSSSAGTGATEQQHRSGT